MDSIAKRIEWILETQKISGRELSRRSGLDEVHVGKFLSRVRSNPNATIEAGSLTALAKGARVSIQWLATGEGSPFDVFRQRVLSTRYEGTMIQFPDANETSERQANQTGRRFIEILTKRVQLCERLMKHKEPVTAYALASYSRQTMAKIGEIENELDELIEETVADILNRRRDRE